MTEPATVLVCGSLHLDIVVDAPSLPSIDETINGTSVNYAFGGKGGNQAVAASLHGAKTRFAGCIGEDEFGKTLHAHLIRHNINCENLQKTNGASGMSVAIVDDNGDYGAVIVSSANLNINSDAIHLPSSAKFLLLQNEIPEQVNEQLAKKAQEKDIPVMLNAAPFRTLPEKMVPLI
ncbi:MAG: ribokinase, partial [Gammaproteobacteria bacterium]|nr:ribokinase [Gammaproteobacteria bacterium]